MEFNESLNPLISDFELIRKNKYKYIDKTHILYQLIKAEGGYFILNRPRRFGKTLIISTLNNFFQGKKHLFEKLFIYEKINEWEEFPILIFDFSQRSVNNIGDYKKIINLTIKKTMNKYDISINLTEDYLDNLSFFFESVKNKFNKKLVILIDEYDTPLLNNLNNDKLCNEIQKEMNNFLGFLKSEYSSIRLFLAVGITTFFKNNIFSGANNIIDINLNKDFINICGFTEEEIKNNFDKEINNVSNYNKITKIECYNKIKKYYDGYKFSHFQEKGLYNPIDILSLIQFKEFNFYWFKTGIPSSLVELIKTKNIELYNMINNTVNENQLIDFNIFEINPVTLFFQSGYLTIKNYDSNNKQYELKFTNYEIEFCFYTYIQKFFFNNILKNKSYYDINLFKKDLEEGKIKDFCERLKDFFFDNNYQIMGNLEIYYHNCVFIFCKLLGFNCDVEIKISNGRIDLVVKTLKFNYIFEFKYNKSSKTELRQIKDKVCMNKYKNEKNKKIIFYY